MKYGVGFAPEAAEQLVALQRYLAQIATPDTVTGYVERIVAHCESFSLFPHGGRSRSTPRHGLAPRHDTSPASATERMGGRPMMRTFRSAGAQPGAPAYRAVMDGANFHVRGCP